MLVQFSVRNFKIFKDEAKLSLVASNTGETENISTGNKFNLKILKSAVIYGANASGKTKLFEAFGFMKYFVVSSSKNSQSGDPINVSPFKLSSDTENAPSEFEIIFIHEEVMYRYGFEVDAEKIVSEWLFYRPNTKEIELFYRDSGSYETHARNFSKGKRVIKEGLVRDNALLLSVAAQFNDDVSTAVIAWFNNFNSISGLDELDFQGFSMSQIERQSSKEKVLSLLKAADLGIDDIQLQKWEADQLPEGLPKELRDRVIKEMREDGTEFISDVFTTHRKYNADKEMVGNVKFSMEDDESSGTRKFFALSGPILDVIESGAILVIDELDSKLHPKLVSKIVALFNSPDINKKNAQLIFNTHDTNLLSSGLFRRDQVWFTEKNKYGESKLYSLADFKTDKVRKNEAFEGNYLKGKYGGVPFLNLFDNLKYSLLSGGEEE